MFVVPFALRRAASLREASSALQGLDGEGKVLAGGQSLMAMINLGLVEVDVLIDLSGITDHRDVRVADGFMTIGALIRHAELENSDAARDAQPLLVEAAHHIGNSRVRARGTLGGSLAHSDPAAELPLVMVALGAQYRVQNAERERWIPADDFHLGYYTTALDDDELVSDVRVPILGPGWGWGFYEISRRRGDFAVASAAVLLRVADGRVAEARVALGGVADRPNRMGAVEAALTGAVREELAERVGVLQGLEPVTDTSASADYRQRVARVVCARALDSAFDRAVEAP